MGSEIPLLTVVQDHDHQSGGDDGDCQDGNRDCGGIEMSMNWPPPQKMAFAPQYQRRVGGMFNIPHREYDKISRRRKAEDN